MRKPSKIVKAKWSRTSPLKAWARERAKGTDKVAAACRQWLKNKGCRS